MKRFYIVTNRAKDKKWYYTDKVRDYITGKGLVCLTMKDTGGESGDLKVPEGTDCIIVLGGDGTLLQTAREVNALRIPLIGINLGTLGYLTDIEKKRIDPALDKLIEGDYTIEHRMMLYGKVYRGDRLLAKDTALNDIVISRDGYPKIINLENYVGSTLLNKYSADGVIVSTATGSTGYSLSAGGPIISPEAELFLLTPLASQSLINRSVILPDDEVITVRLGNDKYGGKSWATVVFDGDTRIRIESGDEVRIRKSRTDTLTVKISDMTFLDVLAQKLNPMGIAEVMK